jgi:hypothetical protein
MSVLKLPLAVEDLPPSIQRFGNPNAPAPQRGMAARGLVPVRGADLVTLLVQLCADPDQSISKSARETLGGVPESVLLAACEANQPAAILDWLADEHRGRDMVLERIVQNRATADSTIARIARIASEPVTEIVAVNQQRLLGAPEIIEALYHNHNTRMSTADRLVELAARHEVELTGIAAFKEHVEAIRGQLIAEPADEPLPSDIAFQKTLEEDEDDPEAIERDKVDGKETLKARFGSLRQMIDEMTLSERIRYAAIGKPAARAILVRDSRKLVSMAAIRNMTAKEAAETAHSKEVGDEILGFIGRRKQWIGHYMVKRALVFNPKTPPGISLRFLSHLHESDLKSLARSRDVSGPIKSAATQRYQNKMKGRK